MDGAEDTVTLNTHLFINFQIQMLLAVGGQASPVPPKPLDLIFMTTSSSEQSLLLQRLRSDSQNLHDNVQPYINPVLGHPTLPYDLFGYQACIYTQIYAGKAFKHINKC